MHHAYPLECPYPQEDGTASVQTPEEWMAQTGEATQEASPDEMRRHVEADVCAVDSTGSAECGEESIDLPWSMTEELLVSSMDGLLASVSTETEQTGAWKRICSMHPLLCLLTVFLLAW